MSIRLHHELGECAVVVDTAQAMPASLAGMHAASGAPRPVEEYVFEYVDGSGETRVLGEESETLGGAGIVGCDEVIEMRMEEKYAARAQLAACGEDVYGWVSAASDVCLEAYDPNDKASRGVRAAVKRAMAAGRSGKERLQLLAAAEVPYAGCAGREAGRALAKLLARTGPGGDAAEVLECCKEMGGGHDAMGAALLHASDCFFEDDMTAMSRAELVGALVAEGAPLDFHDEHFHNGSALIRASRNGHADVVDVLISKGAAVDLQDRFGCTALQCAVGPDIAIVEALIRKGVALDVKDHGGRTALIEACTGGYLEVASALISNGAALDVQGEDGNTALHLACVCGHAEVAEMLIRKGAALDIKAEDGKTALMAAFEGGTYDAVEAMMRRGATLDKGSISQLSKKRRAKYLKLHQALCASDMKDTAQDGSPDMSRKRKA